MEIITNSVEILAIAWGFDITSAYGDLMSFLCNELDLDYEWSHVSSSQWA